MSLSMFFYDANRKPFVNYLLIKLIRLDSYLLTYLFTYLLTYLFAYLFI